MSVSTLHFLVSPIRLWSKKKRKWTGLNLQFAVLISLWKRQGYFFLMKTSKTIDLSISITSWLTPVVLLVV